MDQRGCPNKDLIIEKFKLCTPLFLALGDANRQSIVLLLLEFNRLNVNQITEKMNISRPAISHHLKILRQAGLIDFDKSGKEKYYFLSRHVRDAFKHIRELLVAIEADR